MDSFASGSLSSTPHPRWIARASWIVASLIGASAMAIMLLTPESGVIHGALPVSHRGAAVAHTSPSDPGDEPCFCEGFHAGLGGIPNRHALPGERRRVEQLPTVDPDTQQITIANGGAVRAGMWIMHNTKRLEQDPRAFLRLMSHLARQNGSRVSRLPGEAPDTPREAQSESPAISRTPAPRIDH